MTAKTVLHCIFLVKPKEYGRKCNYYDNLLHKQYLYNPIKQSIFNKNNISKEICIYMHVAGYSFSIELRHAQCK